MQISLEGKRAFVTAGGAGMGRATVLAMHKVGAKVYTCDIDRSGLDTLPDDVSSSVVDVSNSSELNALFDEILPDGLDFMINNAGVAGPTKLVEDITDDEWRTTMAVGIDSQFYCARRVAPVFKAQGHGVIINLISGVSDQVAVCGGQMGGHWFHQDAGHGAGAAQHQGQRCGAGQRQRRPHGTSHQCSRQDRRPRARGGAADVCHGHVDAVLCRRRGDR